MKVFTILCPTDFSECSLNAIEYAAKLGEKYKARLILRNVNKHCIIICESPVDCEDFAKIGIKTSKVMPDEGDIKTAGTIDDIVTGVIRGETISQDKLDEIIRKVKLALGDA